MLIVAITVLELQVSLSRVSNWENEKLLHAGCFRHHTYINALTVLVRGEQLSRYRVPSAFQHPTPSSESANPNHSFHLYPLPQHPCRLKHLYRLLHHTPLHAPHILPKPHRS